MIQKFQIEASKDPMIQMFSRWSEHSTIEKFKESERVREWNIQRSKNSNI